MLSGRRKLLLADDSPTIQKVISLTFGDEGMEVVTVGEGDGALRALADEPPPDVVLADVVMPGPDGYELCERIKRDPRLRSVPVVLLVGTFEPFNEAEARRVGADTVLTKPFQSIRDLVSKVGSLLGGESKHEEEEPASAREERARAQAAAEAPTHARPEEPHPAAGAARDARADDPDADTLSSFADLGSDDELIEARPADAFGAAARSGASSSRPRPFADTQESQTPAPRWPEASAESSVSAGSSVSAESSVGAESSADAEPVSFGANGHASHAPGASEARDAFDAPSAFRADDHDGDVFDADVFDESADDLMVSTAPSAGSEANRVAEASLTNQTGEREMHEETSPRPAFDTRAAGAAAADEALLDLGRADASATGAVAEADDFILDLDFEDEPAHAAAFAPAAGSRAAEAPAYEVQPAASFAADNPSAFAEAAHGEQPLDFGEPLDFAEPAESPAGFGRDEPSAAFASAEAQDEPWRDVVLQDGPRGFAFGAETGEDEADSEQAGSAGTQAAGSAPRGFIEPEVVPADEPVPAVFEGEFTDGSVEGDVPKAPAGAAAPQAAVGEAPATQESAGYTVGEARAGVQESPRADQLSPETIDAIARRVVELMSDKVIREIAWEVVPELAELLVRQRLEEGRQK